MGKGDYQARRRRERGFSLIEMLISILVLSVVLGVVAKGINTMQLRNTAETNRLDLTQGAREFMDQITNDLRQSGFPRPAMFDPSALPVGVPPQVPAPGPGNPPICTSYATLACGLMYVAQDQVWFEGDVDGTGVSEEWIKLVQTAGTNNPCTVPPCVIQRGTVPKATYLANPGVLPPFYTEVNNIMNTNVFTAYDNASNDLVGLLPIANAWAQGYNNGLNIRAIGITLFVQSAQRDLETRQFPNVTMVSTARVND
jgi:prepilin-type N-terminal cleavage/methylation domain-containing protein